MILRRVTGSRFSEIVREWEGDTAILLGGGPSLTRELFDLTGTAHDDGFRVIAVNDAYLLAPWADVLYAADASWHANHARGIDKPKLGLSAAEVRERYTSFAGDKCSIESQSGNLHDDRIHVLPRKDFPIAVTTTMPLAGDDRLIAGYNSLHQALNLAIRVGVSRALLLGCDGGPDEKGRTHFHGGHPTPVPEAFWGEMRKSFSAQERAIKAAGVTVINCNPNSAIDSFPKISFMNAMMECAPTA